MMDGKWFKADVTVENKWQHWFFEVDTRPLLPPLPIATACSDEAGEPDYVCEVQAIVEPYGKLMINWLGNTDEDLAEAERIIASWEYTGHKFLIRPFKIRFLEPIDLVTRVAGAWERSDEGYSIWVDEDGD